MKNAFYIAVLALALVAVFAVPARSQGLILRGGMNISGASTDPKLDNTEARLGFNAALLGDLPVSDRVHVLAGPGYEQQGMNASTSGVDYRVTADYVTIPVMLSLRTPSATPGRPSMRFFLNLGVEPAFLMNSNFDFGDVSVNADDRAENFEFALRAEAGIELPFAASGPGALVGAGYTYGLTDADSDSDSEWHNMTIHIFLGLKLEL